MPKTIPVDVISDVICPWCYIGKRRLEQAIAAYQGQHEIEVSWHPYQLNPTMPKAGISRREYRSRKFGSWQRSQELDANVSAVGEAEGLRFDFERMERTPNTADAHRIIWLAGQHGLQDAVVEAMFQAYFTEGRDIGNQETVIEVATDVGLNRQTVSALLESDDGTDAIATGKKRSSLHHVSSVPFFIVNDDIALSGAQESNTFLAAFKLATDP